MFVNTKMRCKSTFILIFFSLPCLLFSLEENRLDIIQTELDSQDTLAELITFCETDLLALADTLQYASPTEIDTWCSYLQEQYGTLSPLIASLWQMVQMQLQPLSDLSLQNWLGSGLADADPLFLVFQEEILFPEQAYSMLSNSNSVFTKTDNPQKVQTGVMIFCAGALVCRYSSLLLGMIVMAVGADMIFSEITVKKEVREKLSKSIHQVTNTIKTKGKQVLSQEGPSA